MISAQHLIAGHVSSTSTGVSNIPQRTEMPETSAMCSASALHMINLQGKVNTANGAHTAEALDDLLLHFLV